MSARKIIRLSTAPEGFACVQAGSLTLIDESGEEHSFKSGDALFLPEGVVCSARATTKVRLYFAVLKNDGT
jgi:uncharacterized cupin superfamily protein